MIFVLPRVPLAVALALATWPASAATHHVPDLSGYWGRNSTDFESVASRPGPVTNKTRTFYMRIGDDTNPVLKPEAAARVRRAGEITQTGVNFPTPSNECTPWSPPYMWRAFLVQVMQQKDKVTILYVGNHHTRTIRLNSSHPKDVTPSWSGDSIGHYEGDTLVVDTVGIKSGRNSMVDNYGTPYSEMMHLVERIKLVDANEAKAGSDRLESLNGRVAEQAGAASIDPGYAKGLRIEFTIEDDKFFTTPWSGALTYRPALGVIEEGVCADSVHDYNSGTDVAVPRSDKPDF